MIFLTANNAQSVLAGAITNIATTLNLSPGAGALFPSPGAGQAFKFTMIDAATGLLTEIMHCTSRAGDVLTVIRGQEGTTAQAWNAGDIGANLETSGFVQNLVQFDQYQNGLLEYGGVAGGTANAATLTIPSGLTALPDGMRIRYKASAANSTTTPNLTLTLGATVQPSYTIVKGNNLALVAGDIPGANADVELVYNSSYGALVLQNPAYAVSTPSVTNGPINGVSAKSGAYTVLQADNGKVFECTTSMTLTLGAVASYTATFAIWVSNVGTGTVTIAADGSETILQPGGPNSPGTSLTLPFSGGGTGPYNVSGVLVAKNAAGTAWEVVATNETHGSRMFTAGGTWICPAGVTQAWISGAAPGAGGGGCVALDGGAGGGGAGQATLKQLVSVVPGTSYTVTVPAGAAGGTTSGTNGSNGSTASFGALVSLTGGTGGSGISSGASANSGGAAGGAGGAQGGNAHSVSTSGVFAGAGGSGIFGAGGAGGNDNSTGNTYKAPSAGAGYGAGGGGAAGTTATAGGAGAPAFFLVEW